MFKIIHLVVKSCRECPYIEFEKFKPDYCKILKKNDYLTYEYELQDSDKIKENCPLNTY